MTEQENLSKRKKPSVRDEKGAKNGKD